MGKYWFKSVYVYFVAFILLALSCTKRDNKPQPQVEKEDDVKISSFIIEKKYNITLPPDVIFDVKKDTIFGKLSKYNHSVTPTFVSDRIKVTANKLEQRSCVTKVDFKTPVTYSIVTADGKTKNYFVKIIWNDSLPHITINTDGNAPIVSKDDYVNASLTIDGKNIYDNFSGKTQIKGRGNSTWNYPKKPYRLKLNSKASLFGLSAEKDWVLLANYLDETQLLNNIALYAARALSVPFTNDAIPVELTLNEEYKGIYLFTEQIEVETNRVNVGNDGLLLELDSYYDEDPKFKSNIFQLPIMVKNPDVNNTTELNEIKMQFQQLENSIAAANFPNNNYLDYIDAASVVNYLIVFMLADNEELNHPKSVYMHKTANGKFIMGPAWDFDWAYGFEGTYMHFSHYNSFFWQGSNAEPGTFFFSKFLTDPYIKNLLKQQWQNFLTRVDVQGFIDEWSFIISGARTRDYALWHMGNADYSVDVAALKTWINNRINYLTPYINGL